MSILPEMSFANYEKQVNCPHCKWEGKLKECIEKRVVSSFESWQQLAGRDGWEYLCPNCKWIVYEYWLRMS